MKAKVAVLLATYNGLSWLPLQIRSILNQNAVDVLLFVSDDFSDDGTWEWLQQLATQDSRVRLLPQTRKFGSAAANFFRLIVDVDVAQFDYVAFSDQDDIWDLSKLARHTHLARSGNYDGVSSNVTAFWSDGKTAHLIKSQPQKELDFLFESAGPGCSYLMTSWLINEVRKLLLDPKSGAKEVALHDWLVYAVCRSSGKRWYIDEAPSVLYRQHTTNEFGANYGVKAKLVRLKKIRNQWYRFQVLKILDVCMRIKPGDPVFIRLQSLLKSERFTDKLRRLCYVNNARRKGTDRFMFAFLVMLF